MNIKKILHKKFKPIFKKGGFFVFGTCQLKLIVYLCKTETVKGSMM